MSNACNICGEENYRTRYIPSREKELIDERGICFSCAFWTAHSENPCRTVIDNVLYSPTPRPKGAAFSGMGGRRFDIEYFTGERITTYDLWSSGPVPERFQHLIPNTARFLHGAASYGTERTGLCWGESKGAAEEYSDWHVLAPENVAAWWEQQKAERLEDK